MNIIVNGCTGAMGKVLTGLINADESLSLAAGVSRSCPEYSALSEYQGPADCVIDFSNHSNTNELLSYCEERGLPVVIATTGQTEEEKAAISAAAEKIPVFYSGNMSLGIALLVELAKQTAKVFPDADIEIIERHHI